MMNKRAKAITKSDTVDVLTTTKLDVRVPVEVYVGGAGNVAVVTGGGDTVTFTTVTAGSMLPVSVFRVLSTGTTATNMVAVW